jgi:diaminopimelate decarboxylase
MEHRRKIVGFLVLVYTLYIKFYEVVKLYDLDALIKEYGYPLYIYDESEISSRIGILKNIFKGFSIFYSLKANPNRNIVSFISGSGLGADCASPGEIIVAASCGIGKDDIFYSSPGKTVQDIEDAADKAVIIADSPGELERMNSVFSKRTDIGVRINPGLGMSEGKAFEVMGGRTGKFGIDEDAFFDSLPSLKKFKNINIAGIHVYYGSGMLDAELIIENFRKIFDIAKRFGHALEFIDFGGGLGIPYEDGQREIDYNKLRDGIDQLVTGYGMKDTRLVMESGRFIAATCGRYVTKITDIKDSHEKRYYIIHGGMNGFFRPTFTKTNHKITVHSDTQEKECVTVAGNLCTPIDIMAENIMVSRAKAGDILEVADAGAYGFTMSLKEFISQRGPTEIYIDREGYIYKC